MTTREPTANPPGAMPDFIVVRERDAELEAGFVLAGRLVTNIPRWKTPRAEDVERIKAVIQELLRQVREMPDDAIVSIWEGPKPPDGLEPPFGDGVLERWMASHLAITVRIDPGPPEGGIKVDSAVARQIGLPPRGKH